MNVSHADTERQIDLLSFSQARVTVFHHPAYSFISLEGGFFPALNFEARVIFVHFFGLKSVERTFESNCARTE